MNLKEKIDIERIKKDFQIEKVKKNVIDIKNNVVNIKNLRNGIESKNRKKIILGIILIYFARKYKKINIPILTGILIGLLIKYKK